MKRILFICTGNTCRSPMAQALFLKILSQTPHTLKFEVLSAGILTDNGFPASPEAIMVMADEGIDISNHQSRQLDEAMVEQADIILTMTYAHCRHLWDKYPHKSSNIFSITKYVGNSGHDISDPYGKGKEAYIKTLEQLWEILPQVLEILVNSEQH